MQCFSANAQSSQAATASDVAPKAVPPATDSGGTTPALNSFAGQNVARVTFAGVDQSMIDPLPKKLPLQPGQPLDPAKVRESLRSLYATGLYRTIEVDALPSTDGLTVLFTGQRKLFVGRITIDGVNNDNLLAQLTGSTKLNPGTIYSDTKLLATDDLLKQALEDNGYYEGKISRTMDTDQINRLENVHYDIQPGPVARV